MNEEVFAKQMEKDTGQRGSEPFSPCDFTKFEFERTVRGKR